MTGIQSEACALNSLTNTGDQMTLGPVEILILFFVTLGPLKLLGPFAHATSTADAMTVRQSRPPGLRLSTICVVAAGFVGASC